MLASCAVGLLDELGDEHLLARPEADLVPGQQGDLLTDLAGEDEIMSGHDDGDTVGLQPRQDGQQSVPVGLVQAVEGLVLSDSSSGNLPEMIFR